MCVLSADKGEGFSLHVGGGAPMMRVNGQLYSMLSRRMEHCWFFVDSSFDPYFKKKNDQKGAIFRKGFSRPAFGTGQVDTRGVIPCTWV